jgi:hypothetical protein
MPGDIVDAKLHGARIARGEYTHDADIDILRESRVFHRGIVIETLCDPSLRSTDNLPAALIDDSNFLEKYFTAPRNSIICLPLTSNNANPGSYIVCYPFFSAHLCMPMKPGEQVWIVKDLIYDNNLAIENCYWISRVAEALSEEDVNFTSFTRDSDLKQDSKNKKESNRILDYPNQLGKENIQAVIPDRGDNAINEIMSDSREFEISQIEPIPRLTKRPGDLVLQGSNNTAIILGNDRGFDLAKRPNLNKNSNAKEKFNKKSGTIDIVSGRGRYFIAESDLVKKDRGNPTKAAGIAKSTQPFIAQNNLQQFETDKNPAETQQRKSSGDGKEADPGNTKTNPVEGDPDFLVDASRVYVSEKSDIDKKLGLDQIKAKGFATQIEPINSAPCVAVKSDHVRIVARKTPLGATKNALPDGFKETNGTIRIVKEGNSKEDLAVIYIEADGTIQISGKQIYLGRQKDDGGAGNGPADGEAQPYIKYKELEELWGKTMDELNKFCDSLLTHVTPGYGSPSPQINKAAQDLKAAIESNLKSDIETVKSERIFGE